MPVWAWLLMILVGLGLLGGSLFFGRALLVAGRMRADILARGDDAMAWVIDVEPKAGLLGPVALVLVSPDRSLPDDDMRDMVARLQALRTRQRKPADQAEREAVRLTRSQLDNPGRERLPDGFTGRREVYSFFMDLGGDDDENLPKGALRAEWYPVRVIWDEYPTMMVVPPPAKRRRGR